MSKLSFKSNMKFQNLKIWKLPLLVKPKVFKHLQLISIKNPIFNVSLNIVLFNNWKKSNACRFLNYYALKWYEVRYSKKLFRGSNFVQKCGPSYKKRRQSKIWANSSRREWNASRRVFVWSKMTPFFLSWGKLLYTIAATPAYPGYVKIF